MLTDHGLAVALEGVAARTPIPLELDVDLPRRMPPRVEVAAYYVICEALAASTPLPTVSPCTCGSAGTGGGSTMEVHVVDDGVGGLDAGPGASRGSGLEGLRDRVAALGGQLEVISPVGEGTRVRAVIPCG